MVRGKLRPYLHEAMILPAPASGVLSAAARYMPLFSIIMEHPESPTSAFNVDSKKGVVTVHLALSCEGLENAFDWERVDCELQLGLSFESIRVSLCAVDRDALASVGVLLERCVVDSGALQPPIIPLNFRVASPMLLHETSLLTRLLECNLECVVGIKTSLDRTCVLDATLADLVRTELFAVFWSTAELSQSRSHQLFIDEACLSAMLRGFADTIDLNKIAELDRVNFDLDPSECSISDPHAVNRQVLELAKRYFPCTMSLADVAPEQAMLVIATPTAGPREKLYSISFPDDDDALRLMLLGQIVFDVCLRASVRSCVNLGQCEWICTATPIQQKRAAIVAQVSTRPGIRRWVQCAREHVAARMRMTDAAGGDRSEGLNLLSDQQVL